MLYQTHSLFWGLILVDPLGHGPPEFRRGRRVGGDETGHSTPQTGDVRYSGPKDTETED